MNNAGPVIIQDPAEATMEMLCLAVVELQRAFSETKKAQKKRDIRHQQQVRELRGRITTLEGAVRTLQLVRVAAAAPSNGGGVYAVGTPTNAAGRKRKRDSDEDTLTPPPAPKKRRRAPVVKVSF